MKNKAVIDTRFKVHVHNLLQETLSNKGTDILRIPFNMMQQHLVAIGERAAELNDPILNDLMCMLAIYSISDPESPNYDQKKVEEIFLLAEQAKENKAGIKHCGGCGKKTVTTHVNNTPYPLDLCDECLPNEATIAANLAHHAETGG